MEEDRQTKILIPISYKVDKEEIIGALNVLRFFRDPLIVLLHIIEIPVTAPLDIELYSEEKAEAEKGLESIGKWLQDQEFRVKAKVAVARNAAHGIVEEANTGRYSLVILMKRRPPAGFKRLFYKSHTDMVTSKIDCLSMIIPIQ